MPSTPPKANPLVSRAAILLALLRRERDEAHVAELVRATILVDAAQRYGPSAIVELTYASLVADDGLETLEELDLTPYHETVHQMMQVARTTYQEKYVPQAAKALGDLKALVAEYRTPDPDEGPTLTPDTAGGVS